MRRTGLSIFRVLMILGRVAVWVLLRVLPSRRHAVVHGWPDSESNAIEVVRALRRRYPGQVYWLLRDPGYLGPSFARSELADSTRVHRVRKGSLRALALSLTAELTFFTHGLYTAVRPPRHRLVVNLWHGDGPKATRDTHLVRSSVVVSGARLWGDYKGHLFGVRPEAVAVVGNPRIDEFAEPLSAAAAASLGLDPQRRSVLWLPTYRQARGPRARQWEDGPGLTTDRGVRHLMEQVAEFAAARGAELLVKPHPLDTDDYEDLAVRVVRDQDLVTSGVSLYQLLGHCDALISDVSSVWVDYLVLDRPTAFYIPDLEQLRAGRGLNVDDLEALLPGPRLTDAAEAVAFLSSVLEDKAAPPSSWPGHERIGPVMCLGAADRLLNWLDEYRAARGAPRLFLPVAAQDRTRP